MRNMLALAAAALIAVAAVGWYRGWYSIGTTPGLQGHQKVIVDVNTRQATKDIVQGEEKVKEVLQHQVQNATTQVPQQVVPQQAPQHPAAPVSVQVQVPPVNVQVPVPPAVAPFVNTDDFLVLPGVNEGNVPAVPAPVPQQVPAQNPDQRFYPR